MKHKLRPLSEQVVVITGASSGIGLVTARQAAARGAAVVVAARNTEALESLAEEIRAAGGRALAVTTDVGREEEVARLADAAVAEFGRFDSWVNNAGVSIFGMVDEVSTADMHRMFATNYWGVVYGSRAALAHYKGRTGYAGAIINTGSVFGDRATPVQSTYASSKHAVHGWTDAMRMDMEAQKVPVSVTLLHPGRINHDRTVKPALLLRARVAVIPIGARLDDRELVHEGRTCLDAGEADAGNAVHRKGDQQPMPVDRAVHVEVVGDGQADLLPLFQANERRGHRAVHADRGRGLSIDGKFETVDRQRDLSA